MDRLSDAGSIPARSTKSTLLELLWLKKFEPFESSKDFLDVVFCYAYIIAQLA